MAVYSVYDYGRKVYSYYEDGQPSPTHAGPPAIVSLGGIGVAPDAAAWSLPPAAHKIGEGEFPRGRIASLGSAQMSSGSRTLLLAAAAYAAWRYLR